MASRKKITEAVHLELKQLKLKNEPGEILVVKIDTNRDDPAKILAMVKSVVKKALGDQGKLMIMVMDSDYDIFRIKVGKK
jgi:hypothetical protein